MTVTVTESTVVTVTETGINVITAGTQGAEGASGTGIGDMLRSVYDPAGVVGQLAGKTYVDGQLAGKAPTVHTHTIAAVTGLQTALDAKAALAHTHAAGDITSGTMADARIAASNVTQHQGSIVHQSISGAGTNTHAQIDTHIADATKHRVINDAGSATTDLWSASKITTMLAGKANTSHTHVIADTTGLQTALDAKAALSHTHTASQITDFTEATQDVLGSTLVAGSNVTINYNDVANTVTISATGGGGGGGVTDHGDLTGLGDDDHPQYMNTARGDVRYAPLAHTHAAADITSGTMADARIAATNVTQHQGSIAHQSISGAGTNTHAQIDTHIADATKHRVINDAGSATTDLWSASKITTMLAGKAASTHTHVIADTTGLQTALDAKAALSHTHAAGDITSGTMADARIAATNVTQHQGSIAHQSISGAGTNTHAQIDTHIADATKHRSINDAGSATTDLWSASKITTMLAGKANSTHTHAAADITSGTMADARIAATNVTQHQGSIAHQSISGAGTNTHAQIDTHIADATKHRVINDAGTAVTDLWSASKIGTEVAAKVNILPTPYAIGAALSYWYEAQERAAAGGWGVSDDSGVAYSASDFLWVHGNGYFTRSGNQKQYANRIATDSGIKMPNVPQVTPSTIFIVVKQTGSNTGDKTLMQSVTPATTPVIRMKNGKPNVKWNTEDFSHSTASITGTWAIIMVALTSSQISIALNGGTAENEPHVETGLSSWYSISDPTTNPIEADIGEVLVFDQTLSTPQIAAMVTYLKAQWNIA